MNDWYFYQERGKTVGPYNLDDIKGRIRDGRIKVFDLIYKDGEPAWRMVLEHSTLRAEFKSSAIAGFKERPWVCLQKKSGESTEFVTTGPYSRDEIREGIQAGSISYSDFAWKDGFSEWKRVGSLEEFNPRVRPAELPPVPKVREESSAELLKNIVEMKRMNFSLPDFDIPPEAKDESSISTSPYIGRPEEFTRTAKVPVTREEVTQVVAPPAPEVVPPVPKKMRKRPKVEVEHTEIRIQVEDEDEDESSRPWMDWGLVGALVLLLAGSVMIVSRFMLKSTSLAPEATSAVSETKAPPPAEAPGATAETESQDLAAPTVVESRPGENKQIESKKPESLNLSVQAAGSGQPRLIVRSDGTAEYPVYLQIIGLTGQVSEGGSYYRLLKLSPNGNWMKPIEFGPLKLPQGKFIARAETGELTKEVKFSWGVNDAKAKQNLVAQRKTWAYAIWKERLALYRLTVALEKQIAQALQPGKRFSGRGWEPLVGLKRSSGGNYLMFDDWWELHDIVKDAKKGVSPTLLARTQRQRDRLASFSVWK